MLRKLKAWWLNRKLRSLQSDLDYMTNYEQVTGAPKPGWVDAAIVNARIQVALVNRDLDALGRG
ncbi:hypothetical protein GobsT_17980 [Gemmata obscuriglobus]|uniref:Uncharacterized protein n=1 Tax=Gemmata obscuriglobus TaxID=114 RepID=A0A2Z3H675_9BACT|nr:hypothetical protein [Gemmata obscuriglobus]AWM39832.1 hypothetical protein C1280_24375 [Gemmata obscuriglobus]QEG27045.1 hypothetical protein GobsT_17980 [Gemmata obscuriglobus]VTS03428.1 unnamed protein product [Gemmata obscuriglobus UQM 2246]